MLVLFDIDGTLLSTRRLGVECMRQAVFELFAVEADFASVSLPGGLDPLIWRALCEANGIASQPADHERFRACYARILGERLAAEPGRARALPGIPRLLEALAARAGCTLGLLTGNYPETSALKIAAAGLDFARFEVAAFGCDAPDRRGLVPVALERYALRAARPLGPERVAVIGDTPRDVDCARAHGARCLAVATGVYGVEELAAAGADLALADLADTAAVLAWLEAAIGAPAQPAAELP